MLVAQLIIGAFFACLVIWGFIAFNAHTKNKFGYSFFTKFSFLIIGASLLLIGIGNEWQILSLEENGDVLNGILIMAMWYNSLRLHSYLGYKSPNQFEIEMKMPRLELQKAS